MWKHHQKFERHSLVLLIGILIVVSIGGLVEIAPLFFLESTIEKVKGVRPYTPLELVGRDIYIEEGCVNCHSQIVRPIRAETVRYGEYGDVFGMPKGDALATARIAGIMGAKRTPDLIPLCHPLSVSGVKLDLRVADDAVEITASVKTTDRTGVEMEALTAVAVAGLTLHDMIKAVDPAAVLDGVRLDRKEGGKSGVWTRP